MDSSVYERMPVDIYKSSEIASREVAAEIAKLIQQKQKSGEKAVLGLATGSTPTGVYDELIRLHKEEGLSFKNVVTFNLDEYYPIEPTALQSYVRYMHENLFDHIDIPEEQVHIPDGTIPREEVPDYCREYEQKIEVAGGLDLQLLGIGRTGHIGFNEPGSVKRTRTRLITLDNLTRKDAAGDFFGEDNVPRRAITMGIGTILDAEHVILMAWGEHKAEIIARAVEGEITEQIPATYLQDHDDVEIILDEAAASELTRNKTPWLVGPYDWTDPKIKQAAVWLCERCEKPVLKLTDEDYNENGLGDLITDHGPAYNININVFNQIQHTITGWPGGKPEADDTHRPERAKPFPKRVLVFSPHPDDDVYSMGGTLRRLVEHGHEVHVAYQTSGSNGVHDEDAVRYANFVKGYHRAFEMEIDEATEVFDEVQRYLDEKSSGDADSKAVRKIKGLIRAEEARAACRYVGIPMDRAHFLNMPFYETGRSRKKPLSDKDISLISNLVKTVKPHQVYAAGDLADPHGTHRICLEAIRRALMQLKGESWMDECYLWLYRGTWKEWEVHEIEMAVPLSPGELKRKRNAILNHQSQKDRPLFPGDDQREFWERIDQRNRATARKYDKLGLAEYEAIEGFARWSPFS